MIPLLVTGVILLLLVTLLLAPVRLEVRFREGFSVTVKYLFFSFPLTGEKAQEPPPQEAPSTEKPEEPSSENGLGQKLKALLHQEGLRGFLQSLQELAQDVKSASQNLLKHVKLKRFDLYVCLGGKEDAAQAAILYGQVCGVVYTACGTLFGLFPCRKKTVTVDLDYNAEDHRVDFFGAASIGMLFLLKEGLILLYRALPFFRKLQAAEKQKERISRTRKQGESK